MTIHSLLTPENSTVIFIDQQPQMTFGVASIDRQLLINNTIGLAKAAKVFNVPTILTTVETQGFSGYMWPQLLSIFGCVGSTKNYFTIVAKRTGRSRKTN
jgi:nicotinamidase-related amidase